MSDAIKKRFRIDKKLWILIFCLFGLMAVALTYLLVYIPANEEYLNVRRFKAIQRIKRNIDEKQQNTFQLIQTLADAYAKNKDDIATLNNYLDFQFGPEKKLQFISATKRSAVPGKTLTTYPLTPAYLFHATPANGNIEFMIKRIESADTVEFNMNYSVESFFSPILPGAGFDEFIIVVNKQVIFETFPSGLGKGSFDTLVQITPKLEGANTKSVSLGGTNYQAYIQPFAIGTDNGNSIVIGLIQAEKYRAEKMQLPSSKIIWIITLAILVIILLPWLKLFNLGIKDRLTMWDGAFSFMVAMLLISVIFLGFAILAIRYQPLSYKDGLVNLSYAIEKQATGYVADMKGRLDIYDCMIMQNKLLRNNIVFLGDTTGRRGWGTNFGDKKEDFPSENILRYQLFNENFRKDIYQVFWLNRKSGLESFNWSPEKMNGPHANLKKRKYFREHMDSTIQYAAEQVISWTTGTFRTLISRKSDVDTLIACISFDIKPLTNATMPTGYGFAVLENNGEVIYHSNNIHNLNENFADETSNPDLIKNIIKSKIPQHILTKYKGAESNLFIRPISLDGFKYSIVVFYDQELELIKDAGAFSFTIIMLFIFFLIALCQMVLVVIISSRKNKLNNINFETDWIWPRPSLKKVYDYSGYFQFLVFFKLIIVYYLCNFLSFLFILVIAVSAITLFVNLLYRKQYQNQELLPYVYYKNRTLIAVVFFLFVVNFFAIWQLWSQPLQCLIILIFQVFLFIGGYFVFHSFKAGSQEKKIEMDEAKNFIKSYSRMAITRLIITSGLPALFFYQYAYNYQQSLIAHHTHIRYLENMDPDHPDGPKIGRLQMPGVYLDNYWITGLYTDSTKSPCYSSVDFTTNYLLKQFRIYNTSVSNALDAYSTAKKADSPYIFYPPLGRFIKSEGFSTSLFIEKQPYPKLSSSNEIVFHFPHIFKRPLSIANYLYWLLFMGFIYALYRIIIRVVRHIFALDFPGESYPDDLLAGIISDKESNNQIFITGLPGSGKMKIVENILKNHPENGEYIIIDLYAHIPANFHWGTKEIIIFSHFEHVVQSKEKCVAAINLFEKILVQEGEKPALFILSTITPGRIISLVELLFIGGTASEVHSISERYRVFLSSYISLIFPIQNQKKNGEMEDGINNSYDDSSAIEVHERLNKPLLKKYPRPAEDQTVSRKFNVDIWFDESRAEHDDHLTWSVFNMAEPFYRHIWESLCPEERFLIYDLAEEGLVNQTNKYHLSMLIQKGLIIRKDVYGQPELFNTSFRSFVLTSVDKTEALALQNEVKGTGTWSDLGRPLTLVTLGILAILLISQKQAFVSVFGFLTAIGAAIPTLNAIFSIVKSSSTGNSK